MCKAPLMAALLVVALAAEPDGPHTSKEWQIWAYSRAAPPFLAKEVTVLDGTMKVLRKGTNGWTCVPANPTGPSDPENGFKSAHEAMPLCGDPEVFKWIQAWFKKETPKLDQDGWAWMLHGDLGEDNANPGHTGDLDWSEDHAADWIVSGPHLMIMPKDAAAISKSGVNTDFNSGAPFTMFVGSEYAHTMIPYLDYYHWQKQVGGSALPAEPAGDHSSAEWQIWAYSTGAPPFIAADATVLDATMKPLKKGTNGWTCVPGNPKGPSDPEKGFKTPHEAMPVCGDAEVFKWIQAFFKQETPKLDRDGWGWMLHGDLGEDNAHPGHTDDVEWGKKHKKDWIESGPHLMIMPKDAAAVSKPGMTSDFTKGEPWTMFKGSAYAHVMIPQPGFYAWSPQSSPLAEKFTVFGQPLIQNSGPSVTLVVPFFCVASLLLGAMILARLQKTSRPASQLARVTESDLEATPCLE